MRGFRAKISNFSTRLWSWQIRIRACLIFLQKGEHQVHQKGHKADGNTWLNWDITTHHLIRGEITVTLNKSWWRSERAPNCVYLRHSPHPALLQILQLIRHTIITGSSGITVLLMEEGRTNLKPSFSRQVWSGLIVGSFSLSPSRRASRMWKWRGVSTWSTAGPPSSGRRASGGRTSTMKVGKERERDVSGNRKRCVGLCVCVRVCFDCGWVHVRVSAYEKVHRGFTAPRTVSEQLPCPPGGTFVLRKRNLCISSLYSITSESQVQMKFSCCESCIIHHVYISTPDLNTIIRDLTPGSAVPLKPAGHFSALCFYFTAHSFSLISSVSKLTSFITGVLV